jgi:hypothetical protein
VDRKRIAGRDPSGLWGVSGGNEHGMADPSDIDESDTSFGRAAREKQEAADEMLAAGEDPTDAPEGENVDPRPRAGGKASEGAPPAADVDA